jgi:beta-lactamase class A
VQRTCVDQLVEMCDVPAMTEIVELEDLLATASRTGGICVLELDGRGEATANPDRVMQTASAFKIAVALEVYCQVSGGELDPDEQLRFDAERAPLRDGTLDRAVDLMLRLSDNIATNVLLHRVTRKRIMARLRSLGLTHTTVSHSPWPPGR